MTYTGTITFIGKNKHGFSSGTVESAEAFTENDGRSRFNDFNCYNSKVFDYNVGDVVEFEIKKVGSNTYPSNLRHEGVIVNEEDMAESPVLKDYFVDWYELKNDLAELYPDAEQWGAKIIWNIICDNNKGRNNLVFLKNGTSVNSEDDANALYIPTGFNNADGKELYLFYRRQYTQDGFKFVYSCIVFEGIDIKNIKRSDMLFAFARFDFFDDAMNKLKEMAQEEEWGYNGDPVGTLKKFFKYTFAHEYVNDNISKSEKGTAAFNTGLVDRYYNIIYAVLKKSNQNNTSLHPLYIAPQYVFDDFAIQKRGDKHIMEGLDYKESVPYFNDRSETVINTDYDIVWDAKHVIEDRVDRIPLDYFRRCLDVKEIKTIMEGSISDFQKRQQIKSFIGSESADAKDTLQRIVEDFDKLFFEKAKTRVKYNFRAAVPCYNPEKDQYGFLLPVSLGVNPRKADIAAVVSTETYGEKKDKRYRIQTIIPLDWAYLDARLVCNPESSWLIKDKA